MCSRTLTYYVSFPIPSGSISFFGANCKRTFFFLFYFPNRRCWPRPWRVKPTWMLSALATHPISSKCSSAAVPPGYDTCLPNCVDGHDGIGTKRRVRGGRSPTGSCVTMTKHAMDGGGSRRRRRVHYWVRIVGHGHRDRPRHSYSWTNWMLWPRLAPSCRPVMNGNKP